MSAPKWYAVHEDGHRIPLDDHGSYTPDATGKWTFVRLSQGGVLNGLSLWSHGEGPEVLVPLNYEVGRAIAEGLQERIDRAAGRLVHRDDCPILDGTLPCACAPEATP